MNPAPYRFSHEAMATTFEVIVAGQEREYARQAAAAVFREVDRINALLNKYDAGSDIGQINLLKPGESVRVSLETLACLEKAIWAHTVSGGLFDPTVGTGFEGLKLDRPTFSIGWEKGGSGELDLGGIAKGFAIDQAAEILADWEIPEVIINGGTSTVLALGKEWELGVGGPWGERAGLTSVKLKNQALSGSGTEVKGAHILNPKTGKPAGRHLAAWAIHSSAAAADALSTAFMMMAPEMIRQLCAKNEGTAAWVVNPDGSLVKIEV